MFKFRNLLKLRRSLLYNIHIFFQVKGSKKGIALKSQCHHKRQEKENEKLENTIPILHFQLEIFCLVVIGF